MSQLKEAIENAQKQNWLAQEAVIKKMRETLEDIAGHGCPHIYSPTCPEIAAQALKETAVLYLSEEPEAGEFTKKNRARIERDKTITDSKEFVNVECARFVVIANEALEHLGEACDIIDRQAAELKKLKEELQELSDQMMRKYERWDEPERGTLLGWHERITNALRVQEYPK